jgi:hypothetical protein
MAAIATVVAFTTAAWMVVVAVLHRPCPNMSMLCVVIGCLLLLLVHKWPLLLLRI